MLRSTGSLDVKYHRTLFYTGFTEFDVQHLLTLQFKEGTCGQAEGDNTTANMNFTDWYQRLASGNKRLRPISKETRGMVPASHLKRDKNNVHPISPEFAGIHRTCIELIQF